jgi:succinoglycan biosynthesis transport protein ExoP
LIRNHTYLVFSVRCLALKAAQTGTWGVLNLSFGDYWLIVRKRWGLMVLVTVLGLLGALAVNQFTTPMYLSTAKLFVSSQTSDSASDLLSGSSFTQQRVKSYADLVTSPSVLNTVINELDLHSIRRDLAERITATVPLNEVIIQIDVLDESRYRAAQIANAVATSLTTTVNRIEAPLSGASSPVKLSMVQPGTISPIPDSPKPLLNFALGFFVGLVLSIGLSVLLETLDNKIRSVGDISGFANETILGGIALNPIFAKTPLVVQSHPKSRSAESYRQLRTNIQFVEAARGRKSIVITSAMPSDGKTTTSTNLALAFAQAGKKVIIVDADFRKPKLHKTMGLDGTVGVTNLLIGQVELPDVVQQWGNSRLDVLPAGKIPPNPSELLGSEPMKNLIAHLEQAYDVVLLDTAPLLPVTDAAILSTMTGGVVLVTSVGKTTKPQLRTALSNLANVDGKVLGFVMNRIPTRGAQAYQYRYAYKDGYGNYGYAYQDVYAQETKVQTQTKASKTSRRAKKSKAGKA